MSPAAPTSPRFAIILRGHDRDKANTLSDLLAALQENLRMPASMAAKIPANLPCVIRRFEKASDAKAFAEKLRSIGAVVEIDPPVSFADEEDVLELDTSRLHIPSLNPKAAGLRTTYDTAEKAKSGTVPKLTASKGPPLPDTVRQAPICPHHRQQAPYLCPSCNGYRCMGCLVKKEHRRLTWWGCAQCGSEVMVLRRRKTVRGPVTGLPMRLAVPFETQGLIGLIALSGMLTILYYLPLGFIFGWGLEFGYLLKVTHASAYGADKLPSSDDFAHPWDDILKPFLQSIFMILAATLPAFFFLLYYPNSWPFKLGLGLVAVGFGVVYFPAAVMIASIEGTVFGAFNYPKGIRVILRLMPEYLLTFPVLGAIAVAWFLSAVVIGLGGAVFLPGFILNIFVLKFLVDWFAQCLGLYFMCIGYMTLGSAINKKAIQIGLMDEADFYVPLAQRPGTAA